MNMKESALDKEGTLYISGEQEVLLNPECFKVRINRLLGAMDEFWDEFHRLKKYVWEQRGDRE
jgi:hypothetical protein